MLSPQLFLIILPILGILSIPSYYWTHYDGKVPPAAVTAGDKVYIGRAPFERGRMLVGQITDGVRKLTVTSSTQFNDKSVHIVEDDLIEILCSPLPHSSFLWVTATPETVLNISGKVEGGYEPVDDGNSLGVLYIGRIHYGRTFKVGKVVGYYKFEKYSLKNTFYYASDGGTEAWEYSWEVLVYNERHDESLCPWDGKIWHPGYYWRKYNNGEVPCDGVLMAGNFDYGGAYIGRGQFDGKGLLVGPIPKGAKYVIVTHSWVTPPKIDKFVEILCSRTDKNLIWVDTTNEKILDVNGLVIGGFEGTANPKHNGVLYIGAQWTDGGYNIGKVLGYHKKTDAAWMENRMYYAHNNKELVDNDFYVLTCAEK